MANEDTHLNRRDVLKGVGGASIAGLAGCTGGKTETETTTGTKGVKAAWLYNTAIQSSGWTYEHHQGLQAAREEYDWLTASYIENVDPNEVENICAQYVEDGYDVIYGTSFGFQTGMYHAAERFPDTIFDHCSGFKSRENMGRYFGRLYQGFYLAGIASGLVTESNTLGFVGAFPIPEVLRWVNAWTAGATSVNPDVTTKVRWLNTWFDPSKSKNAANALIDVGADVIASSMNSAAPLVAANNRGVW
ncbi:MAG: BMP family ABC transporter substrate-binding protein, partial [Halodesulfurarchaeum sp.]